MGSKTKSLFREMSDLRVGDDGFGRATANIAEAMRHAASMLRQQVGENYCSHDVVSVCQMIMDERYRLESVGEEWH